MIIFSKLAYTVDPVSHSKAWGSKQAWRRLSLEKTPKSNGQLKDRDAQAGHGQKSGHKDGCELEVGS